MENKKVLFLDHDGVICLATEWGSRFKNKEGFDSLFDRFNQKAINVLNEIIDETDCEIVISSDWRFHCSLSEMQQLYKIRGIGKSPMAYTRNDLDWKLFKDINPDKELETTRVMEILSYVKEHNLTNWVAVDDMDLILLGNFVHTPKSKEGIKQLGIKEKIIKFLK
jgi:hypothetical protein